MLHTKLAGAIDKLKQSLEGTLGEEYERAPVKNPEAAKLIREAIAEIEDVYTGVKALNEAKATDKDSKKGDEGESQNGE